MASMKVEDALLYVDRVKQQFSSTPGVYREFLDILSKYKAQRIEIPDVVNQMSLLFSGYPELLRGFNAFCPREEYEPDSSGLELTGHQPQQHVMGDSGIELQSVVPVGDYVVGRSSTTHPVKFMQYNDYVKKARSRYLTLPKFTRRSFTSLKRSRSS